MDFDVRWRDFGDHLAAGVQPVIMLEREKADHARAWAGQTQISPTGTFWVPTSPLISVEHIDWAFTDYGDFVRVPVFNYDTQDRSLPHIFGTGLQIGMAAIDSLRHHTQDAPKAVVMFLGHECQDLPGGKGFRCFVGIAIRTK